MYLVFWYFKLLKLQYFVFCILNTEEGVMYVCIAEVQWYLAWHRLRPVIG